MICIEAYCPNVIKRSQPTGEVICHSAKSQLLAPRMRHIVWQTRYH